MSSKLLRHSIQHLLCSQTYIRHFRAAGVRQTCQSREERREVFGQDSNRGRRHVHPNQPGGCEYVSSTVSSSKPFALPSCPQIDQTLNTLPGWWEEEAGESKDHAERLPGLQRLYHLGRERPHYTAEPRGALESFAKQHGITHLDTCTVAALSIALFANPMITLFQAGSTEKKVVIVSVSPQSRASLAARYDLTSTDTGRRLTAFFKGLGKCKL